MSEAKDEVAPSAELAHNANETRIEIRDEGCPSDAERDKAMHSGPEKPKLPLIQRLNIVPCILFVLCCLACAWYLRVRVMAITSGELCKDCSLIEDFLSDRGTLDTVQVPTSTYMGWWCSALSFSASPLSFHVSLVFVPHAA